MRPCPFTLNNCWVVPFVRAARSLKNDLVNWFPNAGVSQNHLESFQNTESWDPVLKILIADAWNAGWKSQFLKIDLGRDGQQADWETLGLVQPSHFTH